MISEESRQTANDLIQSHKDFCPNQDPDDERECPMCGIASYMLSARDVGIGRDTFMLVVSRISEVVWKEVH